MKGLYRATYLARQCNMDPSKSVRLAIWLDGSFSGSSVRDCQLPKPWEVI
jgi:hypothetical protein